MFCSSITDNFCPLWAVDGRPYSDTFFTCFAPPLQARLPPMGHWWVSSQWCNFHMFCSSITGKATPCGPLMGVLPVMHFSHVLLLHYRQGYPLWAIDGCPPSDAIFTCLAPPLQARLPPVGRWWASLQWCIFHMFCSSITGKATPYGPLMGVLPVMQFSHVLLLHYRQGYPLWAVDGRPYSDAFFTCFAPPLQARLPPMGHWWVSSQWCNFHMSCSSITGKATPCGPLMGVLPVLQFCPLWAVWWLSSPWGSHAPCGPFFFRWVVLPVRQPCPLRAFLVSCLPHEAAMPTAGLLVSCPLRRQPFSLQSWRLSDFISWLQYLALPELLYYQMPKTHPARRSSRDKASEGPTDDQTMSDPRRARKASKVAPLSAHHQDTNTPGPSAVGAEPACIDRLLDRLDSRIQTAVNEAQNARQAAVSSPTVPAAPHLEDVEQAVQASMLASISESMTGTGSSCSFIPSSIPILNQIPLKINQKIEGGGGVIDLRAMLSG